MTTATAITLDRDVVERLLVEVDALAMLNSRLNGANETWIETRFYAAIEEFEEAVWGEHRNDELHDPRAYDRVDELWREFVARFDGSGDAS